MRLLSDMDDALLEVAGRWPTALRVPATWGTVEATCARFMMLLDGEPGGMDTVEHRP